MPNDLPVILAGYFNDDDADELTNEPVLNTILNKDGLAFQPTLSRFFNRMDEETLKQFEEILKNLRNTIYSVNSSEMVLVNLDSTLLNTYDKQEWDTIIITLQMIIIHCFVMMV